MELEGDPAKSIMTTIRFSNALFCLFGFFWGQGGKGGKISRLPEIFRLPEDGRIQGRLGDFWRKASRLLPLRSRAALALATNIA